MAAPASVRSRSARSEGQSTARRQTGALHAAGVDYGRLITERGRQDHAGQHGSIVEGPSAAERSGTPLITDVTRTPTTSFKIENPNLAEHPVDDSGGETRRRDGPVIGESASVDAPSARDCPGPSEVTAGYDFLLSVWLVCAAWLTSTKRLLWPRAHPPTQSPVAVHDAFSSPKSARSSMAFVAVGARSRCIGSDRL